jgi:hypothetical protein
MNRRGPADCRANLQLIVRTILPRARYLAAKRHPRLMTAAGKIGKPGRKVADAAICRRLRTYVLQPRREPSHIFRRVSTSSCFSLPSSPRSVLAIRSESNSRPESQDLVLAHD